MIVDGSTQSLVWRLTLVVGLLLAGCSQQQDAALPTSAPAASLGPCGSRPLGCTELAYAGSGPSVVILGDSITHQARAQLHDVLDDTHSVIVSGVVGATFAAQAKVAERYAADVPSVAVINLGTNDAWSAVPTTDSVAHLDAMLAEFPDACAVLVTITTRGSSEPTRGGLVYSAELANRINEAVGTRADALVDWSAATDADPAQFLKGDGVHLTEAGNRLLSELVAEGVASCG